MSAYFFIGSSPSMASTILRDDDASAAGVMVSMTQLGRRKSDFEVGDWILDSGAFTEVARHGGFRLPAKVYAEQIVRWQRCGRLLISVAQDYMCEPFVLERTGLTVADHQRLTIERYLELRTAVAGRARLMPVLQGWTVSDYLQHVYDYGRLLEGHAWVGVGSVCRRNGSPRDVFDILRGIKLMRPDLRLHGFGLKLTALSHSGVRNLLYSCDSMAWSYPRRFMSDAERVGTSLVDMATDYQVEVRAALDGAKERPVSPTAGAGNGQGRKPMWNNGPTRSIRVPEVFVDKLLAIARDWDAEKKAS